MFKKKYILLYLCLILSLIFLSACNNKTMLNINDKPNDKLEFVGYGFANEKLGFKGYENKVDKSNILIYFKGENIDNINITANYNKELYTDVIVSNNIGKYKDGSTLNVFQLFVPKDITSSKENLEKLKVTLKINDKEYQINTIPDDYSYTYNTISKGLETIVKSVFAYSFKGFGSKLSEQDFDDIKKDYTDLFAMKSSKILSFSLNEILDKYNSEILKNFNTYKDAYTKDLKIENNQTQKINSDDKEFSEKINNLFLFLTGNRLDEAINTEETKKKEETSQTTQPITTNITQDIIKDLKIGELIKTNDFEITIKKIEFSYDVMPDNTSSFYTHYPAKKDKVFIHIDTDVKNIGKRDLPVENLYSIFVDYNNGYNYTGKLVPETNDGDFSYDNMVSIKPLETIGVRGLVECPKEVEESKNPVEIKLNIDNTIYRYKIK